MPQTMDLIAIHDDDNGTAVVCAGHVLPLEFARGIDCDDVEELIGDYESDVRGYPTERVIQSLAAGARHTWGKWSVEEGQRIWEEVHKNEPGAEPFTVIDENQ